MLLTKYVIKISIAKYLLYMYTYMYIQFHYILINLVFNEEH